MDNILISIDPCWMPLAIEYQRRTNDTTSIDHDDERARRTASMMIATWSAGLDAMNQVQGLVAPELKGAVLLQSGLLRFAIADAGSPQKEDEQSLGNDPVITRPLLQLAQMYLKQTTGRPCVGKEDEVARSTAQMITDAWKEATRQTANLYHIEDPQLETVTLVKGNLPLMCGLSGAQQRAAH